MNIVQIEDEIWDSGIAHYALTLTAELKARGHNVHFWGQQGSIPCAKAREAGLETLEIKNPWLSLPSLRSRLKKQKIQIINAHTGSGHSLAAAAAAGLGIPVVRTRGDARPPTHNALTRALSRKTKAFIAANSHIKEQLDEIFPNARVQLIFQGIAPAVKTAPLPDQPTIGILGRLDPVKGHEDFIVAAKEVIRTFPKAKFLIAGRGPEERMLNLKAWAGRLGLSSNVEFLGFVPDAEGFMAGCRIGVVASLGSEAVSRAALEWMAQERPLISTRVGCLPDLIDNEKNGFLVPAGHPGQIAIAVKQLLKNPKEATTMGSLAKKTFDDRFSLKRFADETEKLYAEFI